MRMRSPLLIVLGLVLTAPPLAAQSDDALLARARAILAEVPLIDGHNDLPWQIRGEAHGDIDGLDISVAQPDIMTDIARLRKGGVGGQFWSAYVPMAYYEEGGALRFAIKQIDIVHRLVERYPDTFEFARTADDIERIHGAGRIASLIGLEGGHAIENSLDALRAFHRLGVRYMTITHSGNNDWADASTDIAAYTGLTPFGEAVIREMNRIGIFVDTSHVSEATMHDILDIAEAPVIFSHSSARALTDHVRNVPDAVLERLPDNGGVVMVTFVTVFISQEVKDEDDRRQAIRNRLGAEFRGDDEAFAAALAAEIGDDPLPRALLTQVADHIDHIVQVAGIDHAGLGSDFDGISNVILGLEDVSTFPALLVELLRRGYSDDDVKKIVGLNLLRAMHDMEATATRLSAGHGPIVEEIPGEEDAPLGYD